MLGRVNGLVASSFLAFFNDFFAMFLFPPFFFRRPHCLPDAGYYAPCVPSSPAELNIYYVLADLMDARVHRSALAAERARRVDLINAAVK